MYVIASGPNQENRSPTGRHVRSGPVKREAGALTTHSSSMQGDMTQQADLSTFLLLLPQPTLLLKDPSFHRYLPSPLRMVVGEKAAPIWFYSGRAGGLEG